MTRLHRILAPTDLSAPARQAAERAALIARDSGAHLVLQHVVSTGALDSLRQLFGAQPGDLPQRLLDEARDELRELGGELHTRYGVAATVHLSVGAVASEITRHANAVDGDLLVLGARGASPMRDLLLGSTTERVLRQTGRPLLVVRREATQGYHRVLVPVDFSPRSLQAIRMARLLAPYAALVLLHAVEVPFEGRLRHAGVSEPELADLLVKARHEADARMGELLATAGLPVKAVQTLLVNGDPHRLILDQERVQGGELIVIEIGRAHV